MVVQSINTVNHVNNVRNTRIITMKKMKLYEEFILEKEDKFADYPKAASKNAKKAIEWKEKYGRDEVQGGTEVGWQRAHQLAKGEAVSRDVLGRMSAFNRHRKNSKISAENKDTPWKDNGHVAWLIWGGDEGVDWAMKKMDELDESAINEMKITIEAEIDPKTFKEHGTKASNDDSIYLETLRDEISRLGTKNINIKLDGKDAYKKGKSLHKKGDQKFKDIGESAIYEEKAKGDRGPLDNPDIEKALKSKANDTGVPIGLLRIVMRRGMDAWNSGHRPGVGQEQWGYARVNAFLEKGDGTWQGADKDVAKEVRDGGNDKKLPKKY